MESNVVNRSRRMYLTPRQVYKKYGYHQKTLAEWADEGKVEYVKSPGGHRRYLVSSLEAIKAKPTRDVVVVLYARVSTASQKDDLKTQIEYLGSR